MVAGVSDVVITIGTLYIFMAIILLGFILFVFMKKTPEEQQEWRESWFPFMKRIPGAQAFIDTVSRQATAEEVKAFKECSICMLDFE